MWTPDLHLDTFPDRAERRTVERTFGSTVQVAGNVGSARPDTDQSRRIDFSIVDNVWSWSDGVSDVYSTCIIPFFVGIMNAVPTAVVVWPLRFLIGTVKVTSSAL